MTRIVATRTCNGRTAARPVYWPPRYIDSLKSRSIERTNAKADKTSIGESRGGKGDGGRARRILNTILRQNTRPSVSYQINGSKEEAAGGERMARLENDSAQRLWNNDRRGSSVHNVTRIHDPNIYLSTIRFTWSVIYGTREWRERQRGRGRKTERGCWVGYHIVVKTRSNAGHRSYVELYRSALRHKHEFAGRINRRRKI